ncbi:MAG TPA: response regulator [Candidatus Paceibacterota bacterium]|nr:response regulator [Verrucomicrobiota bacterium]HSA10407.1 response regulator [Candidatus Paceibacterota bacterium]
MKTLVVLAAHPDFAETIRAGLSPEQYRVIARANLDEPEPLLTHGLADACIVDVELTEVQGIWLLEKLRRQAPGCPVIAYTGAKKSEWEEEAYLQGATHVLTKPVRRRVLTALLERLWSVGVGGQTPPPAVLPLIEPRMSAEASAVPAASHTLHVLRDFSSILTHSLNAEGMLKQFLQLLREILSINRGAIFLRQPLASFGDPATAAESRRLRAACAVGLSQGLLQHFELSLEAGIGGHLLRLGRILRRYSEEARHDIETQKEFEVLGAQVAVPILDRETMLGVAVFDGRITGEPLVNAELELIFHLLEQLGLAIKNIWLHDQLAGNHAMMVNILREISSACIVVSRDLAVLHANKTARRCFGRRDRSSGDLEFSDLPQLLGAKVYQVLKTGAAVSSFKFEPEDSPGTVYSISVVPFQRRQADLPGSALLMAEDLTQSEQLQRLEIEAANLRLVKSMAVRLTHEMGNSMVRLSTYQQLLAEKLVKKAVDQEFLRLMARDWSDDNRRISRLVSQMRYLNVDKLASPEAFPLVPLLDEAYQEACQYQHAKAAQLKYETPGKLIVLTGNREALRYAMAEVFINALQANSNSPRITLRWQVENNAEDSQQLQLEVEDNGPGFTAEAQAKACAPFYGTRNVGLGLGLTIALKIVETHLGKLVIPPSKTGQGGVVRISLPLASPMTQQS